jgi:hypothetical protein
MARAGSGASAPSGIDPSCLAGEGSWGARGPAVIPVALPTNMAGSTWEAGSHSLDTLLRMPFRVEVRFPLTNVPHPWVFTVPART